MTRYAGPTAEALLKRVREEGGLGTSMDFAVQMLSHCQRIIGAGVKHTVVSGSFQLYPEQLIYAYRNQLPDAVDIVDVRDGTRVLQKIENLTELAAYDVDWFRATGSRHDAWLQLGRDLLIIYPAQSSRSTLVADYIKLTTEFASAAADYNTAFDLPNEEVNIALGLAETILLLRSRQLPKAKARITKAAEDVARAMLG